MRVYSLARGPSYTSLFLSLLPDEMTERENRIHAVIRRQLAIIRAALSIGTANLRYAPHLALSLKSASSFVRHRSEALAFAQQPICIWIRPTRISAISVCVCVRERERDRQTDTDVVTDRGGAWKKREEFEIRNTTCNGGLDILLQRNACWKGFFFLLRRSREKERRDGPRR